MKQNSKEDIVKKWAPILDIGLTGSKDDCMSELAELHLKQEIVNSKTEEFPSLLPIAMKVAAKTIGQYLVFASKREIDEVKNKVLAENRDGKIEAIVDGKEFTEKKLEDDIDYQKLIKKGVTPMSAPSGHLFYLDFIHKKLEDLVEKKRRTMVFYKSPGVYVKNVDVDYCIPTKRYSTLLRKYKINKIFNLNRGDKANNKPNLSEILKKYTIKI